MCKVGKEKIMIKTKKVMSFVIALSMMIGIGFSNASLASHEKISNEVKEVAEKFIPTFSYMGMNDDISMLSKEDKAFYNSTEARIKAREYARKFKKDKYFKYIADYTYPEAVKKGDYIYVRAIVTEKNYFGKKDNEFQGAKCEYLLKIGKENGEYKIVRGICADDFLSDSFEIRGDEFFPFEYNKLPLVETLEKHKYRDSERALKDYIKRVDKMQNEFKVLRENAKKTPNKTETKTDIKRYQSWSPLNAYYVRNYIEQYWNSSNPYPWYTWNSDCANYVSILFRTGGGNNDRDYNRGAQIFSVGGGVDCQGRTVYLIPPEGSRDGPGAGPHRRQAVPRARRPVVSPRAPMNTQAKAAHSQARPPAGEAAAGRPAWLS